MKKNPEITTEINECFYKILASFCYSITPPNLNLKKYINSNFFNKLTEAMKIIKSLNDELYIFSIEVVMIEELIKIFDVLSENDKADRKVLIEICNVLKKSNLILQINEEIQSEELIDEFKSLISLLSNSLEYNSKNYFDLLKFIYYKEIKKVPNVPYRTEIFIELIKDPEIIVKSNDIFQILLYPLVKPKKDLFPESIKQLLNSIDYDIALILENSLGKKNEEDKIYNSLNQTLLYFFEKNSLMYFNFLFNGQEKILFDNDDDVKKDEKDKEGKKIMGPLKLFNKCITFLNGYKENNKKLSEKNKEICKLFCLGYIRTYCYMFVDLLDSNSSNLKDPTKIIKEINNSKSLNKIISFYVWKVIYNKNQKNINIFIDPNYITNYKLKEYEYFKNIEIKENPFYYYFINSKEKDMYDKFNGILEKYKEENEFNSVDIQEFNTAKKDIDLFYFSSSNLILSRLKNKQFIESSLYQNFFKNVCEPLFKKEGNLLSALEILYCPKKYKELEKYLENNPNNLNIILHSYRFFINEFYHRSQNNTYSLIYARHVDINKLKNNYYPGNDIKNLPIYSLYQKILNHFKNLPSQGCFVCLCSEGGCYNSIKDEKSYNNYLYLICPNCKKNIGTYRDEEGNILPVKRDNYYRIFKTKNEIDEDEDINYNYIFLDEFERKYIQKNFEEEKGIEKGEKEDKEFFLLDTKIVRSLSQISFRILNFILYSHLFFSKILNINKNLDRSLPKNMKWIEVLSECWKMIEKELNELGISAIDIFINFIFKDLFNALNKHKIIEYYYQLDNFERELDQLINNKILDFKEYYNSYNKSVKEKFSFQDFIGDTSYKLDNNEYPFYKYFYYSDYINDAYLLDKLKSKRKDVYPVLLKVLENRSNHEKNEYSLDNLPNFNEVLNLFSEKYSGLITRDQANTFLLKDIKDEDIYLNNKKAIKIFMRFYNNLSDEEVKPGNLILTEKNKLADFFIDDNSEFGKSYKKIYTKFIQEQNKEISDLLDIKINNNIFEKNCKDQINIQSANAKEIFITNLLDKFSLIEIVFDCSYRKIAIDNNFKNYNFIDVNIDLIEDTLTELLLRNKKVFNDSIISFAYTNEILKFKNTNIITQFKEKYDIKNINLPDKKILYKFYKDNIEKNDEFFIMILNDFIQLILILINNIDKPNEENNLYFKNENLISEVTEKCDKISDNFKELFKDKDSLIICKTTALFEYYRDIIFLKIKEGLKAYQFDLENEQKNSIKKLFENQSLINEKVFKKTLRTFIVLFLNFEKNKEYNIKENKNNIANYLDIPDIWDKTISGSGNFTKELNNIKELMIMINQIIYFYEFLGEDIDEKYFEDVKRALENDEKIKKIEEKKDPQNEIEIQNLKNDDDIDDEKDSENGNSIDDYDDDKNDDNNFDEKKYI